MRITIKQLSEISGFSTATISRVISGTDNVKPQTRETIEKLLLEYNYRSTSMDKRRQEMKIKTVMILVGDLDNWYYMEMIRSLNRCIWSDGYFPMIVYTDNLLELEEEYVRSALLEKYAGLIFINVRGDSKLGDILKMNQIPVVFLNRGIKMASFDTVCNDNYRGGYQSTEYLIKKGHRKIGYLMGNVYSNTARERKRGYMDAMRDHGLTVTGNSVLIGDQNYDISYKCGEKIVKSGLDFTALFCCSYQVMEGLLDALKDYGVDVPEDISVIGFDETPTMKRRGITTICAEPTKMSCTAWNLLKERIHDGTKETSMVYLETKMRERSSVKELR